MIDLDALLELESKATPGRWKIETGQCEWGTGAAAIGPYHYAKDYDDDTDESGEWLWEVDARKDADFINAMRNNIRALCLRLKDAEESLKWYATLAEPRMFSHEELISVAEEYFYRVENAKD